MKIEIMVEPRTAWEIWVFDLTQEQYDELSGLDAKVKRDYLTDIIENIGFGGYDVIDTGVDDGYTVIDILELEDPPEPEPEIEVPEWWDELYKDLLNEELITTIELMKEFSERRKKNV